MFSEVQRTPKLEIPSGIYSNSTDKMGEAFNLFCKGSKHSFFYIIMNGDKNMVAIKGLSTTPAFHRLVPWLNQSSTG